jgi:tryptophan-rich sensory protein
MANVVVVFVPAVVGFATSALCSPGSGAGVTVPFRPPPVVFGIVWPILYLLMGVSWSIARRNSAQRFSADVTYALLTVVLALWLVVYGCLGSKAGGIFVIAAALGVTALAMTLGTWTTRALITPLLTWLIAALLLNTSEVILA